jgi:hypothetical protein
MPRLSKAPAASIFAPVVSLSFAATQYDDCKDFLAQRTVSTECVPIVDEAQLLLSTDGRLAESGYRFNPIGFDAVSRALCAGLSALFNDLSGENYQGLSNDVRPASLAAAVGVYNAALRVRFDALRERSLLIDHQESSIDGFLGLEHRFFDNSAFFNLVASTVFDLKPAAEFARAEIVGRELRLFFVDPESRRQDIHPSSAHSMAAGWYFSNREDAGNAIRAARCIFTKFGPAIAPSSAKTKVIHAGSDLMGRTAVLLSNAVTTPIDMDAVARQVKKLLATPLGFTDITSEFEVIQKKWVACLGRFRIRTDLAKTVVKSAAVVGSDMLPSDPFEAYTRARLSSRNGYDLLCAVLRQSRQEYATYRDLLQSAAMRWLIGEEFLKKESSTYGGEKNGKSRKYRRGRG